MNELYFETRVCRSCGLRYPTQKGGQTRCPICLGISDAVAEKIIRDEERTLTPTKKRGADWAVVLDNIRSAQNVGAIFRSADAFGFERVHLCGITPTPESGAAKKTALGAEDYLAWSYHKNAVELVGALKKEGWKIVALEEGENARNIQTARFAKDEKIALILGNEVSGVDEEILALCDSVFAIPMRGRKRSLNVSVAFGVAAYALDCLVD
ncbi:MAG: RNA methyltransferase [Anaerolineales bacterium]|nr:RNA methyltransferase [Anaerolineales bacterium]